MFLPPPPRQADPPPVPGGHNTTQHVTGGAVREPRGGPDDQDPRRAFCGHARGPEPVLWGPLRRGCVGKCCAFVRGCVRGCVGKCCAFVRGCVRVHMWKGSSPAGAVSSTDLVWAGCLSVCLSLTHPCCWSIHPSVHRRENAVEHVVVSHDRNGIAYVTFKENSSAIAVRPMTG